MLRTHENAGAEIKAFGKQKAGHFARLFRIQIRAPLRVHALEELGVVLGLPELV
jgi:hypothetical protein